MQEDCRALLRLRARRNAHRPYRSFPGRDPDHALDREPMREDDRVSDLTGARIDPDDPGLDLVGVLTSGVGVGERPARSLSDRHVHQIEAERLVEPDGRTDHLADGRVDAKEPSLLDPVLPVSRGHREDRAFARVDVEERVDAGSEIERLAGRLDGRGRLAGRRRLGRRRGRSCGRGVVRRPVGAAEGGPSRPRRRLPPRVRPPPARRAFAAAAVRALEAGPVPAEPWRPPRPRRFSRLGYPPALEHGDGRTAEIPGRRVTLGRLFGQRSP